VAVARVGGEEVFQVGGADLGPAGDLAGGGQVAGEVPEDPQPGLQGDVAERAAACPAGAVLLGELAVVERGDRAGQPGWDGIQVALPPGGGAAAGLVAGQIRAWLVKNAVSARPAASKVSSARVALARICRGPAEESAEITRPAWRKIATAPPG
jgi:hypothetical protein